MTRHARRDPCSPPRRRVVPALVVLVTLLAGGAGLPASAEPSAPGPRDEATKREAPSAASARYESLGRLGLVRERRVELEARLHLSGSHPTKVELVELEGMAGEELLVARELEHAAGSLSVELSLTPRFDEERELLLVRLRARVTPEGGRTRLVERELDAAPERLRLVELWRSADLERQLVLTLSGHAEIVPRVERVLPGAEPLEFVVEVVEGRRTIERHALPAVVGSSVGFEVATQSGRVGTDGGVRAAPGTERGRARLELRPIAIEGDQVDLDARLVLDLGEGQERPFVAETRERLRPGHTLVLPVETPEGATPRSLRITVWF